MCAAGIVIRQGGDLVSTEQILTSGRARTFGTIIVNLTLYTRVLVF